MENKSTPRDAVLAATPEASHRGLLEMALQVGITDPADPIWTMVGLAWAAAFGAETARERLEIIRQETARLPDLIAEEKKGRLGTSIGCLTTRSRNKSKNLKKSAIWPGMEPTRSGK